MSVQIAVSDDEVMACYNVLQELRPNIKKEQFLARVRKQELSGYRLVFIRAAGNVVAAAGIRLGENLSWGSFLYVDDLVTSSGHRSRGYGAKLLSWIKDFGSKEGCNQIHLDSGLNRNEAHRFYEREGLVKGGYHFLIKA